MTTRGKYSDRVATRLAELNNELIQDKFREVAERDAIIAELKDQLSRQQSDIDAEVLKRAQELAGQQIAQMLARVEQNGRVTHQGVSHD